MSDSVYITTPIYYVNDVPHLGHAYTTIVADALARWNRSVGRDVHFVTGTDEHGQKIERAASARGERPIELADRVVDRFRALWKQLNISHDDFIRTTEPRHEAAVARLWSKLVAQGDIYPGSYEGLYCTGCEAYKTEKELEEGICPDHGTAAEVLKEESYFFRLEKYREPLLAWIAEHPEMVLPEARRNKVIADLSGPVADLSVSRTSFSWGIPVPEDPGHVMYVWMDALTNYISVLGWPDGDPFERHWGAEQGDRRVIHLIGKDILWFHTVYWPSFLLSAGVRPPDTVFVHGWWTVEGKKMSKTLGNWIEPGAVAECFGVDALRWFLLAELPFGMDGDFSRDALVGRINSDLANDLGNLANRTLAMTERWCGGEVPPTSTDDGLEEARGAIEAIATHMAAYAPHRALQAVMEFVRSRNRYIDERAPWAAHKQGRLEHRDDTLHNTLEALRWMAAMVAPAMPGKADELAAKLGLPAAPALADLGDWGTTLTGNSVAAGEPLFPRIDPETAPEVVPGTSAAPSEPEVPTITYDQFMEVDLRVGVVTAAEPVAKTDRLLHLKVDLGEEVSRDLVAGIAAVYRPEDILGRRVIVVANLAPRKIRGVQSHGMLLAAGDAADLVVASFDGDVAPGTRVK